VGTESFTLYLDIPQFMKSILRLISASWLAICCGCQSSYSLKDGFYVECKNTKAPLRLAVKDDQGVAHEFTVCEYTNLVVNSVRVYSLKPFEDASQVEISAVSTDSNWVDRFPILIIRGKPYMEFFKSEKTEDSLKSTEIPVTVKLKIQRESDAAMIKMRLLKKFGIDSK
jgi:hypothetical protein